MGLAMEFDCFASWWQPASLSASFPPFLTAWLVGLLWKRGLQAPQRREQPNLGPDVFARAQQEGVLCQWAPQGALP